MATNRDLIKAYLEKAEANDKIKIFGGTFGTRHDSQPPDNFPRIQRRRNNTDYIQSAKAK